ncbi:MAG: histidine kinase, partial [Anaerolineales bacterium]
MTEEGMLQTVPSARERESRVSGGTTIRHQLLGASLFPLAFFGLLSILVTASALYEMTTKLVGDRNAAQAQVCADGMAGEAAGAAGLSGCGEQMFMVNASGEVLSQSGTGLIQNAQVRQEFQGLGGQKLPLSLLVTSDVSRDQVTLSYAQIPGTDRTLVTVEPWSLVMMPAFYYQLVLVALLIAGTLLSLSMLSVSIGRIIRPITDLARTAKDAVPGSVFYPVQERGPVELRSLTASFNQMVIQLAEQQTTLRQYAQKALLSQEEERQRLSHELHDGTVQELVGLAQRLELCRGEMDSDPAQAKRRLDELRGLAQHTLNEVRQISNALRPSILQDLGLAAALQVLCADLERDAPGVACSCQLNDAEETIQPGQTRRLAPGMELAIFRVAQEALTNIRRHAQDATEVCVELELGERGLELDVRDNGCGTGQPDINQLVRGGHLGYAGMYERARLFGGTLEV